MASNLNNSVQKVQKALLDRGFSLHVEELPDLTRTAEEAAQAIGCTVSQIAKSIVFRGKDSGSAILAVTSGSNTVNTSKLGKLAGESITKPDADFVRERTGFVIGGVPPVGHSERVKIFIDEDLLQHNEIWAAAGTPHAVFRLNSSDLQLLTGGKIADIKK